MHTRTRARLISSSYEKQWLIKLFFSFPVEQQDNSESLNLVSFDDTDIVKSTDFTLTTVKSKLYIDCASADDEAEYTCVAISNEQTESATYKLQVSRSPNPITPTGCRTHAKKSHHIGKSFLLL